MLIVQYCKIIKESLL